MTASLASRPLRPLLVALAATLAAGPAPAAAGPAEAPRPAPEPLLTLEGHAGGVWAVAFSPDGKTLATGAGGTLGKPGELFFWDLGTGRSTAAFASARSVRWVDFSPDGAGVAAALHDGTARVIDVDADGERLTLEGHASGLDTAVYSRDGARIATTSWDRTAKVWDAATGEELLSLAGHAAEVYAVAFSPDGRRLATASGDATAKLWDAESGAELRTLRGHDGLVHAVAYSPDGKRVATAGWDKTVRVWDAATGEAVATLGGHAVQALGVAFSPDGKWLASVSGRWGDYDYRPGPGELILRDAATLEPAATLRPHADRIFAVAFSPDGAKLATASWDETVKVWGVAALASSPR